MAVAVAVVVAAVKDSSRVYAKQSYAYAGRQRKTVTLQEAAFDDCCKWQSLV